MKAFAQEKRNNILLLVLLLLFSINTQTISFARKAPSNSPLSKKQESQLKKGNNLAKSGKSAKAISKYEAVVAEATTIAQCLAMVDRSEKIGAPLMDARRSCLQKALSLAKTPQDFGVVALKARQFQYYDITKSAIDSLIASAHDQDQLYALAQKCQEMALNDVAHMAMDKAYLEAKTIPDALKFIKQAKLLNMDDLVRKAIKDLIDDEPTSLGLCNLLFQIEPLQMSDLHRYLLRKAVYAVKTVPDCKAVFDAAKRHGQSDIANLAAFKGRKMIMQQQQQEQQKQSEEAAAQEALKAQEQRAADDLAKQHNNYIDGPGF